MANIKKGDLVQVITGRKQDKGGDRGKQAGQGNDPGKHGYLDALIIHPAQAGMTNGMRDCAP